MTMNPAEQLAIDGILGNSHRNKKRMIDTTLNDIIINHSRARDYQHDADHVVSIERTELSGFGLHAWSVRAVVKRRTGRTVQCSRAYVEHPN
jgi:hypothetical protein